MSGYRTKVKLCGLSREVDVEVANEVGPDFVGFVVDFPKSHRSVTEARLRDLVLGLDDRISVVGVFVDATIEMVAHLADTHTISVAQLHGSEDESYIKRLRQQAPGLTIWKAFKVREPKDLESAAQSAADVVLLDNGQGTGVTFDWGLISDFGDRRPFVLAGGLGPDNVELAVKLTHPWCVDMSSGLEIGGLKDPERMRAAVAAVREADVLLVGSEPGDERKGCA